jgi:hypothetical protein
MAITIKNNKTGRYMSVFEQYYYYGYGMILRGRMGLKPGCFFVILARRLKTTVIGLHPMAVGLKSPAADYIKTGGNRLSNNAA